MNVCLVILQYHLALINFTNFYVSFLPTIDLERDNFSLPKTTIVNIALT